MPVLTVLDLMGSRQASWELGLVDGEWRTTVSWMRSGSEVGNSGSFCGAQIDEIDQTDSDVARPVNLLRSDRCRCRLYRKVLDDVC